jgi:hypothetical protein
MNGSKALGIVQRLTLKKIHIFTGGKNMDLGKRKMILKNGIYALFLVTLLIFSAVLPVAIAIDGEQVETEITEPDLPEQTKTTSTQAPELTNPAEGVTLKNGFTPKRMKPEFDLTRWVDGMPVKKDVADKQAYSGESQNSRARANEDIEMTQIEFGIQNDGWATLYDDTNMAGNQGYFGSFFVGVSTTITASVKNNGGSSVNNVEVNFTIYDYTTAIYKGILLPGAQFPTTKIISSIGAGQTQQATFDWTPPFASEFVVMAEAEWPGDPDYSNNGRGYLTRVAIWQDDIEAGAGSWTHSAPGGNVDDWHISSSMANPSGDHTPTDGWYEGNADGAGATYPGDSYRDNNRCRLVSPTIDLGDIDTGPVGQLYVDYLVCYSTLMTGETEATDANPDSSNSDVIWFKEVSDDGGATWNETNVNGANLVGFYGTRYTETMDGGILSFSTGAWDTEWFTAPGYVTSDGTSYYYNPGGIINENVSYYDKIKFRMEFDDDSDGTTELGLYFDDFIIWGVQKFTPANLVSIRNFTNPEQNNIPICAPNSQITFNTDVKNYGKAGQFYVNLSVYDADAGGAPIFTDSKPLNFQNLEEKTQNWAWTPTQEGNYNFVITAGDETLDWTPADNEYTRRVYVRNPTTNILVVDDDNGILSGGIYVREVERRVLDGLDAINNNNLTYNVYNVDNNETGPTNSIMDDYKVVIWLTGLDNQHDNHEDNDDYLTNPSNSVWDTALKPADLTEIASYLNLGTGNLWLVSPGFLYDNYGKTSTSIPIAHFPRYYLKIASCQINTTTKSGGSIVVRGTPNPLDGAPDTLGDGASYNTYSLNSPIGFDDKGGWITKDSNEPEANEIFYQNSAQSAYNAVSYAGTNYKSVYFAFNFYLIEDSNDRKDLVERIMTFFGLLGGPDAYTVGDDDIKVNPDEEISFQFKVVNDATLQDKYTLTLEDSTSDVWSPRLEISGVISDQLTLAGKSSEDDIYIYATVPSMANAPADYKATFGINVSSKLTGWKKFVPAYATVNAIGDVTMSADKYSASINVNEEVDYLISLENVTNGDSTYTVTLTISGDGMALGEFSNIQNTIDVELPANSKQTEILTVKAGENELAGIYNISVEVTHGTATLGTLYFDTEVNQFYDIQLDTEDETTYDLDPNVDAVGNDMSFDVTFTVENYGNGEDTVTMTATEDSSSPKTVKSEWLEFDDDEFPVDPFDPVDLEFGDETVVLSITLPIDTEPGEYIVLVRAISENTVVTTEDSLTITFNVIKPDLEIDKIEFFGPGGDTFDPDDGTQKGFEITIEVTLANIGDADVTDATAKLDISHDTTDDGTLVPTGSNSFDIISLEDDVATFKWTPLEEATYTITAYVDEDDDIIEIDETNNELTVDLKILGSGGGGNGGGGGDDLDNDGMPDWWEDLYGTDKTTFDAHQDPDSDELDNIEEYYNSTRPLSDDSEDLNGDGTPNGYGMPDGWEVGYGLNPLVDDANVDLDLDSYTNLEEYNAGTDPTDPESYPGHPGKAAGDSDKDSSDEDWWWLIILIIVVVIVIIIVAMIVLKKRKDEYEPPEDDQYGGMQPPPAPGAYYDQPGAGAGYGPQQDVLVPEEYYPPPPQAAAPATGEPQYGSAPQQQGYPPQQPQGAAGYPPQQQPMYQQQPAAQTGTQMPSAGAGYTQQSPQQLPVSQTQPQITDSDRLLPAASPDSTPPASPAAPAQPAAPAPPAPATTTTPTPTPTATQPVQEEQ